jgi:hypothetical protein
MVDDKDRETVLLMTVLQEQNAKKARRRLLTAVELDSIDDQAIYDRFEDLVLDAFMSREPVVELGREMASVMLVLLKAGIKRSRGQQRLTRQQERTKRTLVSLGRQMKAKLVADGMSATQAHLQAAEEAAKEGKRRGLRCAAGYLHRQMQTANQ